MCVCVWNELISSAVAWFFLSSPQTLTSTFILALPLALFLSGFLPPHISLSLSLLPFPSVFSSLMVVVTRAQECSHAPQLWVVENRYPLSTTFQTEMYSSVIDSTPFQATTRTNKRLSLSLFLRLWVALRGVARLETDTFCKSADHLMTCVCISGDEKSGTFFPL